MISTAKKFIFVHIPRTGGSSIESALTDFSNDEIWYVVNQGTQLRHKHATAQEVRKRVGDKVWNEYFTFSIIRNPWNIAVSTYFYVKDIRPQVESIDGKKARGRFRTMMKDSQHMTFSSWLEKNINLLDLPQTDFLTNSEGNMLVDYIGTFENLTNDFQHICEKIKVKRNLPHINGTRHEHYRTYYTDRARAIIAEKCVQDIARFRHAF